MEKFLKTLTFKQLTVLKTSVDRVHNDAGNKNIAFCKTKYIEMSIKELKSLKKKINSTYNTAKNYKESEIISTHIKAIEELILEKVSAV